jgi:hypothetical protein
MKSQISDIFAHDSELDVAHKINNIELDNWISHLNYVKSELNNLLVFYNSHETEQVDSKESLEQRFEIRRADNNVLLKSFMNYKNKREQLAECEDIECDMVFIKEHESYRRMYLFHIDKYRKLKDQFFNEIQGKATVSV